MFNSLPEDGILSSPFLDRIWQPSRPPEQWVSIWRLKKSDRHADHSVPCFAELGVLLDIILLSHANFFFFHLLIRLHSLVLKGGYTLVTLRRAVTPYRDSVDGTRDHVTYQK